MENMRTSICLKKETLKLMMSISVHPRETNEQIIRRIIGELYPSKKDNSSEVKE